MPQQTFQEKSLESKSKQPTFVFQSDKPSYYITDKGTEIQLSTDKLSSQQNALVKAMTEGLGFYKKYKLSKKIRKALN